MRFWIWLENIDKKLEPYGDCFKQFPNFLVTSSFQVITLMMCIITINANNSLNSQNEFTNIRLPETILYGAFAVSLIAILYKFVFPLFSGLERWLKIRFPFMNAFLITGLTGLTIIALIIKFLFLPLSSLMARAIFGL